MTEEKAVAIIEPESTKPFIGVGPIKYLVEKDTPGEFIEVAVVEPEKANHTHIITDDPPAVAVIEPDKKIGRVYGRAPCPTCRTNARVICWRVAGMYQCKKCGLIGTSWEWQRHDDTKYYMLEKTK